MNKYSIYSLSVPFFPVLSETELGWNDAIFVACIVILSLRGAPGVDKSFASLRFRPKTKKMKDGCNQTVNLRVYAIC